MCLSGLSAGRQTKGSLDRFLAKAHAWVVGQVPSRRHDRGNHTLMFLSLSPSLSLSLKINKKSFKKFHMPPQARSWNMASWGRGMGYSLFSDDLYLSRGLISVACILNRVRFFPNIKLLKIKYSFSNQHLLLVWNGHRSCLRIAAPEPILFLPFLFISSACSPCKHLGHKKHRECASRHLTVWSGWFGLLSRGLP